MSVYPSGIDSFTPVVSGVSEIRSVDISDLQSALTATQNTIGTSGSYNFIPATSKGGIVFTGTTTFTVPDGVTSLYARIFGGGGGGGGGGGITIEGSVVIAGSSGTQGGDTWVLNSGINARGGYPGGPGGTAVGGNPQSQYATFSPYLIRYGCSYYRSYGMNFISDFDTYSPQTLANQNGQNAPAVSLPGYKGLLGGGLYTDPGFIFAQNAANGSYGDYAEAWISVNPSEVVDIHIGQGGAGGAGGAGADYVGGSGSNGGNGAVILSW